MILSTFHRDFQLNGSSFDSVTNLLNFVRINFAEVYPFLSEWFNNEEYVLVNTSGSTGTPKSIKLRKEFMINSAKATGVYFDLGEKTTALLCMSPNFIAGKMMLVRALTLGWSLDIIAPSSTPLSGLKSYDFLAMVPIQLQNSLNEIEKVKTLIVGGGAVSNVLKQKIQHLKTEIYATYGMTETITHIAVKKLNNFEIGDSENYSVLPNVQISIDDRSCLVINATRITEEKVITNDVVKLISTSKFKWLGRFDSVINSGGVKLIPEQIEEKIASIIEHRFFLTGLPDEVLGEKLVMVVESQNNSINQEKLFADIKGVASLDKYEMPKEMYVIEKFLETPTSKIDKIKTLKLL